MTRKACQECRRQRKKCSTLKTGSLPCTTCAGKVDCDAFAPVFIQVQANQPPRARAARKVARPNSVLSMADNKTRASSKHEEIPTIEQGDNLLKLSSSQWPDESRAIRLFDSFFAHVHPYVPVLDKAQFLHQWHNDKQSISPLIIASMFALGCQLDKEQSGEANWLEIARQHADDLMHTPQLSTLQGLLLFLKAREAAPAPGYSYWTAIAVCVRMGIDLGLSKHQEKHKTGRGCGTGPECQLRNRIWQTVFVCEVMIGTVQGLSGFLVSLDSVNFDDQCIQGVEESEKQLSRRFTYLVKVMGKMRAMHHDALKAKGSDNDREIEERFRPFLGQPPPDLSLTKDRSFSQPSELFHCNSGLYYHFTVVSLHWLLVLHFYEKKDDASMNRHLMKWFNSSTTICTMQEDVIGLADPEVLQSMRFGLNAHVILTCISRYKTAININRETLQKFKVKARSLIVANGQSSIKAEGSAIARNLLEFEARVKILAARHMSAGHIMGIIFNEPPMWLSEDLVRGWRVAEAGSGSREQDGYKVGAV